MPCGCKKRKDAIIAANTRTARVEVVEGQLKEVPPRPPDVLNPPNDVESIVNKVKNILKP